ncbi:phage tail protein [Janthinobacterium fluminis]|uniref:Phage tail protein n=1 Tax=Janthinobacterium fluminis TaxID=2987524 RepID=A0ABT5K969_9BURK|nr:phage tail protein [Janthinobacterium fluminis]MDC8760332.1 phage tail protein [Janthinobacterium fluminis]
MSMLSSLFGKDDYPPSAFYFKVVLGATLGMTDASFQEVSGMNAELDTETVIEGGENRYVHTLPTGMKSRSLVLKRGIAPFHSPLVLWCRSVFELDFIVPIVAQPVGVYLMNVHRLPIRAWSFANAYPVKWEVEKFNATSSEVAIENITLSYTYSNRLI